MTIHGSIEDTGLPDVLQLLAMGRKSGCLAVLDGEMHGEIYLESGRVSYATIDGRADRLGDVLVKSGRITKEQLQVAVAAQKGVSRKPLGRALLDSGAIERAELERIVRLQVQEAVYFLFTLKRGAFTFNPDRRPPYQFLSETLDADALLLEGARRVDEWSLIQRKIPSLDLVFRRTRDVHAASVDDLTDEQRRLLPLLDGSRDVAGLVDATGMSEFDVGKALYGLILTGVVQLLERRTHVRHLDYRELLAWVVREAEFADPQRRKDAGRHIVECPTCAERLRKIQARGPESAVAEAAAVPATPPPHGARAAGSRASGAARAVAPAARLSAPQLAVRVEGGQPVARAAAPPAPAVAEPLAAPRSPVAPPMAARPSPAAGFAAPRQALVAAAPPPDAQLPPLSPRLHDRRAPDRRSPDRRAGADRRQFERRAGLDRRAVVNASWGLYHEERRRGPRREDDGRPGYPGGRRTSDRERVGAMIASAVLPARPLGPAERSIGPRRLIGLEMRGPDWSVRVPATGREEAPSIVAQVVEPTARPPLAPPAPRAGPRASRRAAAARPAEPGEPEIEWLVSPEESIELMWASRAQRRDREAAMRSGAAAPPGTPNASVRQPPEPVVAAAPPSVMPVIPLRPAAPSGVSPNVRPAASAPPEPPQASPTLGHLSWGDDVAQPRIAWSGGARPSESRALPGRVLAVLAVVVVIGVLGYQAGRVARRAPAVPTAPPAAQTHAAPAPPQPHTPVVPEPASAATSAPSPGAAPQRPAAGRPANVAPPRANVGAPAGRAAAAPAAPAAQRLVAAPPVAAARTVPQTPAPTPPPAPTVGVLRGVVRDANGAPVARARVSVGGTALVVVTDAAGVYEIRDVPDGAGPVQAAADGFVTAIADSRARAGATVPADFVLTRVPVPSAAESDRDLANGGWGRIDQTEALTILGGTLGVVGGLSIESISKYTAGPRQRVRVAQLTADGQRIVLLETRAGAAIGGAGRAIVTSLRVVPPSESYPLTTASATFGGIVITAQARIAPDALRALIERLTEAR